MSNLDHFDHLDKRIMELEIKNAHQEDTIEQLNHIIIEHQDALAKLGQQLKHLQGKVSSLQENDSQSKDTPEPPPPHY